MRLITKLALILVAQYSAAGSICEIVYTSSVDATEQPAMFFAPDVEGPIPMIVALHSWSGDYKQKNYTLIENWCIEHNWAYLHPNFRGPNRRPEATGSNLVIGDIISAVEYAAQHANIDRSSIYLVGASGGGYTSLLVASQHPEIWAGVSTWVPITDLKAWHDQSEQYRNDIINSCGGSPGDSATVDNEYVRRSPITYLSRAKGIPIHINAGIRDGHTGSVPISHSLNAFNILANKEDQLSVVDIEYFVNKAEVPPVLRIDLRDHSYGEKPPLFRRQSGNATVTIFDGSHEIVQEAAIAWIVSVNSK